MDVRPIRDENDYDWALSQVAMYFEEEPEPGSPEAERFDVLATLIAAYEEKSWPIEAPDAVDAIRYWMEIKNHTAADLARVLGSRSRASEILSRKRPLNLRLAYKLHREWGLPAEAVLKPYRLETSAKP